MTQSAYAQNNDDPSHLNDDTIELSAPQDFGLSSTQSNIATRQDVPPDGGYGWICTACVFLINAHTWGVNAAWGVFLAHYLSDSTFPTATPLQYALIGGLSISQALMISPLVALSNAKFGTRITLLIGAFLVSASFLLSSFATQIWHLFLTQGACFGYGMGLLYITASGVLPQWFSARRSLALGIASSGAGFGGLAYNLAAGAAIKSLGLPWTYRVLAICTAAVNVACSLLLKDRNTSIQPRTRAFDVREYGHIETLLVAAWGVFTELGYITLLYSLPSYAHSIGLSAPQGAMVGAVLNLGLAFGRPIVGYCSDKLGRINVALAMTALCGVFCFALWIPAKTYGLLLVFAFASGTVTGTFWSCVMPVMTEVVGLQRLPLAFGMICLPLVLPTTFAEPIALQLVTVSGYLTSQAFVGCMFVAGAACLFALRLWKIRDLKVIGVNTHEDAGRNTHPRRGVWSSHWSSARRMMVVKKV